MSKIVLTPHLVSFLNPLGVEDGDDFNELWFRAHQAGEFWLKFSISSGLSMKEALLTFGIDQQIFSAHEAVQAIGRIWVESYSLLNQTQGEQH
jgi:hypothetical protein